VILKWESVILRSVNNFFHIAVFSLLLNIPSLPGVFGQDQDGDYPDWIELYNPGEQTVDLLNYSLSDKLNEALKWIFPEVSIAPKEFLLLDASGKYRVGAGGPNEVNNQLIFSHKQGFYQPPFHLKISSLNGYSDRISSFVDYIIAEMFFSNEDWPGINQMLWRPRTPEGRWRWIFFDLEEFGFHCLGQDEFDKNFVLAPNPTDVNGRMIHFENGVFLDHLEEKYFDLTGLTSGIYYMKFLNNRLSIVKPIVIY
jgi:hypothetical protein